jgi:hypothetical protein
VSFFYLFYIFLGSRTGRTGEPILMVDGSKCVVWRKEVPFGDPIDTTLADGEKLPKNP